MCDRHVVKMILESAQMLCGTFHVQGLLAPYKKTHENHPCSKWVRESHMNYEWILSHSKSLCSEYTRRYNKSHKTHSIIEWIEHNKFLLKFNGIDQTPFAQAMPCQYMSDNAVSAYRNYYMSEKRLMKNGNPLATWKLGPPSWWIE
jgi:hypothetical protein